MHKTCVVTIWCWLMISGCTPKLETTVSAESKPGEVVVIADLSPSLSDSQRQRIPGLVLGLANQQTPGTKITVYMLATDMGNRMPLVPGYHIPDAVNSDQRIEAALRLNAWGKALNTAVGSILAWPKQRQLKVLTSCYIASTVFANEYFTKVQTVGRRHVIWIGDLTEDCPTVDYRAYRLPGGSAIKRLQGLTLELESLRGVDLEGLMIPRGIDDPDAEVDARTVTDYWSALGPHLGLSPGLIKTGTPGMLAVAELQIR